MKLFAVFTLGIFLSSCASYSNRIKNTQVFLYNNNPAAAIKVIETSVPNPNELVLRDLNLAVLKRQVGDFKKSNQHFEAAKIKTTLLEGTSITDQLQAMTVNDESIEYQGKNYEKLFIHGFSALNYLDLGLLDDARVEVLQAQQRMNEWGTPEEGSGGYLWITYLSGIIYEQLGEFDEALISYRQLVTELNTLEKPVSKAIQNDLLRLTLKQGFDDEHKKWLVAFEREAWLPDKESSDVVVIFFNGLAPLKRSQRLPTFSRDIGKNINIALPYYPANRQTIRAAYIKLGNTEKETFTLDSVDALARSALEEEMPAIVTRALFRKAVKRNLVHELDKKENSLLSFASRIASIATEHADTRSWHTLPRNIQFARFNLKPGDYTLRAKFENLNGKVQHNQVFSSFKLPNKTIKVISIHWANPYDLRVSR